MSTTPEQLPARNTPPPSRGSLTIDDLFWLIALVAGLLAFARAYVSVISMDRIGLTVLGTLVFFLTPYLLFLKSTWSVGSKLVFLGLLTFLTAGLASYTNPLFVLYMISIVSLTDKMNPTFT